jgi:hypothetical protein
MDTFIFKFNDYCTIFSLLMGNCKILIYYRVTNKQYDIGNDLFTV